MSRRFRLPVFTDELLSQILWGMENQDFDYYLNLRDGNTYCPQNFVEEVPEEYLAPLPPWTSADGYQLMVSFIPVCRNDSLKNQLARELASHSRGVFRRFRDVLSSDPESLQQWYDFKDRRMKAFVRSWYRTNFAKSKDELSNDDDLELGGLLADFEVVHLEKLDSYCKTKISEYCTENPIAGKCLAGFTSMQAYEVVKGNDPCGTLIYENVGDSSCILYYYIEEKYREMGLFSLMFDMFNRDLERHQIQKVQMPISGQTHFLRTAISDHEVSLEQPFEGLVYNVIDWNSNTESAEMAYLL